MAATNSTLKAAESLAGITPSTRTWTAIYADLFKARLTFLVLLTTLVGFYAGSQGPFNFALMFHTIFGTLLVASGAAALNQLLEREHDGHMRRTRSRPLPAGHLTARSVLWTGCALIGFGLAYLFWLVNPLVACLGTASAFIYVLVYTPLKRLTWLNTAVGAIPGGLPPLMGWAGARGELTLEALPLFAVLALWQIPHFLAIAWMYRDEYAKAGFKMLPAFDPSGRRTGRQALLCSLLLLPASLCPYLLGTAGGFYALGALLLGTAFAWTAYKFRETLENSAARWLFFASILYLPAVLTVLVLDKA